ncbi:hypothetical protein [Streptomyces solaniscabiei]|uniref:hypothetical protein n=1 Tax=Streptomyces solaniscabiei TaxID=2683255 RepID=UPI001CE3A38F|nr:hypothetical protein [Streptomyces solaniscabiei]
MNATTPKPRFDANGNHCPAPGTEHPFSVSDIARASARLFGDGWTAESGCWGVAGTWPVPARPPSRFHIDDEDDLTSAYSYSTDDDFPGDPQLAEGVIKCDVGAYLEHAVASEGLHSLAERSAAAIHAITGH